MPKLIFLNEKLNNKRKFDYSLLRKIDKWFHKLDKHFTNFLKRNILLTEGKRIGICDTIKQ